ncbi:efflux RND transporter periplasmic adaptor subunit [Pullulanibacillus sp. KACC 23026]|uniref:efflux RND transporter periplasmic adaptor subunit n=1 Tax=Pullulanibacillus sp. KACC 23026 TaxID=3028315 RepID=UPI0023B07FCB|nr:efflux RND transporter periplasmic adaptor subunit [Pullulanibacillus sp. KACC 23026]WEG13573.1 efflux RND transporter periplasmic adaptor subunit [Pullulanibacillus sp. KACC 23026]
MGVSQESSFDETEVEAGPSRNRRWGRWIGWGIVIIVVLLAAWWGYHYYKSHKTRAAAGSFTPTAQVTRGNIDVTVSGSGSLQPVHTATITGANQETIDTVKVKEGDKVKKGQVIATLDSSSTQDQINQDEVNLQKDQLQLSQNEDQLTDLENGTATTETTTTSQSNGPNSDQGTSQNSNQSSTNTQDQIDNLKVTIEEAKLDISQLESTIASLKKQVANATIKAPITGTIDTLGIKNGDQVSSSTTVATITNYSSMELVTQVDELDISQVKKGQTATITVDALSGQKFTGKVTKIAKQGTSTNGVATFDVTVKLDSIKNALSGMTAEASILVQSKKNVLMLPIEAVQTNGTNHYVLLSDGTGSGQAGQATGSSEGSSGSSHSSGEGYGNRGSNGYSGKANGAGGYSRGAAASGGTFKMQPVQVGVHNDNYIEITSGLSEGDVVRIPNTTTSSSSSATSKFGGGMGMMGGSFGGMSGGFGGMSGGYGSRGRSFSGGSSGVGSSSGGSSSSSGGSK